MIISVEGFEIEADMGNGRLTSPPVALCLEYCSGRTEVRYYERRGEMYVAYSKQLAAIVTDENMQRDELYQPYHLKRAVGVVLNEKGEPTTVVSHPRESSPNPRDCSEKHDKPVTYDPAVLLET